MGIDLRSVLSKRLACLLCGDKPFLACFMRPKRPLPAPPGKVRVARYSLCRRCARRADRFQRAEDVLLGDLAALGRVN